MEFIYIFDENQEGVFQKITLDPKGNSTMTSVTTLGLARIKDDSILVETVHNILAGKKMVWITADKRHKKTFSSKGDKVVYFGSNQSTSETKIELLNPLLEKSVKNNTGLHEEYENYNFIRIERGGNIVVHNN